jgi:hypothetical protein
LPGADLLAPDVRRRVVIALVVVLSAVFLAIAVLTAASDLPDLDVRLAPGWLALSLLAFLAFQPILAECWRRLLKEAGGELPVPRAHAIYNVSLLTRYVPTQVLMAVTRIELAHREGVPRSVSVAGFAYEFALGVGTALALGVSWFISLDALDDQPARFVVLLAPVVLLVALHPRVIDLLETRVARRFGVESAHVTIPVARLIPFVAAYLVAWVVAGAGVYALARGIHPAGALDFTALSSYAIGYAAAALAFVLPAGLGARDVATASALSSAMPFSVALAAAIGVRLVQTVIELFYAATTSLWARRSA